MLRVTKTSRYGSRNLADLRAPDVARLIGASSVLVLPVGAVEQHGPHLPFHTDLTIADRVATAAVDERMAGMNPAATVETVFITSGWVEAERAVFTTLAVGREATGRWRVST